jgi:hypothetical protein
VAEEWGQYGIPKEGEGSPLETGTTALVKSVWTERTVCSSELQSVKYR